MLGSEFTLRCRAGKAVNRKIRHGERVATLDRESFGTFDALKRQDGFQEHKWEAFQFCDPLYPSGPEGVKAFEWRSDRTHVWTLSLCAPVEATELMFSLEIDAWPDLDYIAYGYRDSKTGAYVHVKCPHPPVGRVFQERLTSGSPLWEIDSGIVPGRSMRIGELRLFLKGNPDPEGPRGCLETREVLWRNRRIESREDDDALQGRELDRSIAQNAVSLIATGWEQRAGSMKAREVFEYAGRTASLKRMFGKNDMEDKHLNFARNSLIPLADALAEFAHSGETAAQNDAQKIIRYSAHIWMGQKRTEVWANPNAVALRLIALVAYVGACGINSRDRREPSLIDSVRKHAEVLALEAYYARLDLTRIHNHGLFADLGLALAAQLVGGVDGRRWTEIARGRAELTFRGLAIQENDYAVSTENSTHYHAFLIAVGRLLHQLQILDTGCLPLIEGLEKFLNLLKFPNGQLPSFGDSNEGVTVFSKDSEEPWKAGVWNFTRAGYFLANIEWEGIPVSLRLIYSDINSTHKHDDTTSFVLEADGVEWFTDGGFYRYDQSEISRYLSGPVAHNRIFWEENGDYQGRLHSPHTRLSQRGRDFFFNVTAKANRHQVVQRDIDFAARVPALFFSDQILAAKGSQKASAFLAFHLGRGVEITQVPRGFNLSHPSSELLWNLRISGSVQQVSGIHDQTHLTSVVAPELGKAIPTSSLLVGPFFFGGRPGL